MSRRNRATFAVGMFEACDVLRKALIELVTLGYEQKHLILIRPTDVGTTGAMYPPPTDVKNLVVPLSGRLVSSSRSVEFGEADVTVNDNQDATIVRDMETWLPPQHFGKIADALHDHRKVLFVRMHEQRQLAPTCSVLLANCTQQVNTHEVLLPYS